MQQLDNVFKQITGITLDSRAVKPGMMFCAYPGEKVDGRAFIEQAITQGASVIVYDPSDYAEKAKQFAAHPKVTFIAIESLQQNVSKIVAQFQAQALAKIEMIGVTGTNGKTSVTHYLGQAWSQLGIPCGVLGTVGFGTYKAQQEVDLTTLNLTTPDPVTLIDCIVEMQKDGAQKVAMEVSAHALTQGRISGLQYKTAVFTNLTQDHLDYYGDMQNYGNAKAQLFTWPQLKNAVINLDDPFAETILAQLSPTTTLIGYAQNKPKRLPEKYVIATEVEGLDAGYRCTISSSWGEATITTSLVGRFNISNLLACLGVLLAEGVEFKRALAAVAALHPVAGRMQVFGGGAKPRVIVDYAHTPDALEKALLAAREHLKGKLFCVFGCGGDRDPLKRPLMANVAEKNADYVVITQDNPRNEPWQRILADIQNGLTNKENAIVIASREEAIRHAITHASPHDVVVVAGKGHENYQIIGDKRLDFDDRLCVQRILQENRP
jgi:UDP-N-acetylmuramoyl-L-alanyl-D-glutamate--2,6-diaminopimelate ligase